MDNDSNEKERKRLRLAGILVIVGCIVCVLSALVGAPGLLIACEVLFFVFLAGAVVWYGGERNWSEIGQAVMMAVALGVVVGIPQFLIDEEQKARDARTARAQEERDFKLGLTLDDNLAGANLEHKNLEGVRLRGKSLHEASLRKARLVGARLDRTDLSGANLADADLRGAHLREAKLTGAWLARADLRGADLEGADLRGASLPDAKLQRANLEITSFKSSCLTGANLRGARVTGADFAFAVLTGADVRGAQFETDLKPARLGFAGLSHVRNDVHTKWPLEFKNKVEPAALGVPTTRRPTVIPIGKRSIGARVVEVTDGDTVRVTVDPADRGRLHPPGRTRLIGIDAPDLDAAGGSEARNFLRTRLQGERLRGERVRIRFGAVRATDRRSRYLVYMWVEQSTKSVNEELLDSGRVSLKIRENAEWADTLQAAELRAKQRGIGLWRHCVAPYAGEE